MNRRAYPVLLSLLALLAVACNGVSWPSERNVATLRVLGVKAEPASLTPGGHTHLSLLCEDGSRGPTSDPTCNVTDADADNFIEVAWFAGCNNPPNNDPLKCLNAINVASSALSSTVSQTPASSAFAASPTFELSAAADVLSETVTLSGQAVRFGVSYVFFVACAGKLVRLDGVTDRLPVECRDRSTNALLDQTRTVTGYTTIYTYDVVQNANPNPIHPRISDMGGTPTLTELAPVNECGTDADCNSGNGDQTLWGCRVRDSRCLPKVSRCDPAIARSCAGHCIDFQLPLSSFEAQTIDGNPITSPLKSLWVEYYTNAGHVPDDARFGLSPPATTSTPATSSCALWQAPQVATDEARIWIVVRDDRGGQAWLEQAVVVR